MIVLSPLLSKTEEEMFLRAKVQLIQYHYCYALACGIDDSEIRDYDLLSARNSMIGRENFLVKLDNIPVGMVQYQITKSALDDANIVFVHSLYIFDDFQNKGIAYWLLRQLFLMYANHRIECECWYNIPAEVQYEKIGFRTLYSRLFINEEDLRLGPKLDI